MHQSQGWPCKNTSRISDGRILRSKAPGVDDMQVRLCRRPRVDIACQAQAVPAEAVFFPGEKWQFR